MPTSKPSSGWSSSHGTTKLDTGPLSWRTAPLPLSPPDSPRSQPGSPSKCADGPEALISIHLRGNDVRALGEARPAVLHTYSVKGRDAPAHGVTSHAATCTKNVWPEYARAHVAQPDKKAAIAAGAATLRTDAHTSSARAVQPEQDMHTMYKSKTITPSMPGKRITAAAAAVTISNTSTHASCDGGGPRSVTPAGSAGVLTKPTTRAQQQQQQQVVSQDMQWNLGQAGRDQARLQTRHMKPSNTHTANTDAAMQKDTLRSNKLADSIPPRISVGYSSDITPCRDVTPSGDNRPAPGHVSGNKADAARRGELIVSDDQEDGELREATIPIKRVSAAATMDVIIIDDSDDEELMGPTMQNPRSVMSSRKLQQEEEVIIIDDDEEDGEIVDRVATHVAVPVTEGLMPRAQKVSCHDEACGTSTARSRCRRARKKAARQRGRKGLCPNLSKPASKRGVEDAHHSKARLLTGVVLSGSAFLDGPSPSHKLSPHPATLADAFATLQLRSSSPAKRTNRDLTNAPVSPSKHLKTVNDKVNTVKDNVNETALNKQSPPNSGNPPAQHRVTRFSLERTSTARQPTLHEHPPQTNTARTGTDAQAPKYDIRQVLRPQGLGATQNQTLHQLHGSHSCSPTQQHGAQQFPGLCSGSSTQHRHAQQQCVRQHGKSPTQRHAAHNLSTSHGNSPAQNHDTQNRTGSQGHSAADHQTKQQPPYAQIPTPTQRQQQPAAAPLGQQQPTAAPHGQQQPTATPLGQRQPATAPCGQQQPAAAPRSQQQPAAAPRGQQQPAAAPLNHTSAPQSQPAVPKTPAHGQASALFSRPPAAGNAQTPQPPLPPNTPPMLPACTPPPPLPAASPPLLPLGTPPAATLLTPPINHFLRFSLTNPPPLPEGTPPPLPPASVPPTPLPPPSTTTQHTTRMRQEGDSGERANQQRSTTPLCTSNDPGTGGAVAQSAASEARPCVVLNVNGSCSPDSDSPTGSFHSCCSGEEVDDISSQVRGYPNKPTTPLPPFVRFVIPEHWKAGTAVSPQVHGQHGVLLPNGCSTKNDRSVKTGTSPQAVGGVQTTGGESRKSDTGVRRDSYSPQIVGTVPQQQQQRTSAQQTSKANGPFVEASGQVAHAVGTAGPASISPPLHHAHQVRPALIHSTQAHQASAPTSTHHPGWYSHAAQHVAQHAAHTATQQLPSRMSQPRAPQYGTGGSTGPAWQRPGICNTQHAQHAQQVQQAQHAQQVQQHTQQAQQHAQQVQQHTQQAQQHAQQVHHAQQAHHMQHIQHTQQAQHAQQAQHVQQAQQHAPVVEQSSLGEERTGRTPYLAFDTNVYLDDVTLVQAFAAWAARHQWKLLMPLAVMRELDGLKHRTSVARQAREASRALADLSGRYLVRLQRAHEMHEFNLDTSRWHLTPSLRRIIDQLKREMPRALRGDDGILNCLLYFASHSSVVLCTNDRNLRISAECERLTVWSPEELRGMVAQRWHPPQLPTGGSAAAHAVQGLFAC